MFRRLSEAFQDTSNGNGRKGQEPQQPSHRQYIQQQNTYFNALPNIIPSATSGLKGFSNAIQTVSPQSNSVQTPAIPFADDIFFSQNSSKLNQLAKKCESSSLDDLIASQNPNASIGCGWLYTPPTQGSPYPQLSRGFIGDTNGPYNSYNPPTSYNKWFYDLKAAKRQILLDKCKSLSNCADVNQSVYNGDCGYCTDTNQGVPVDSNGNPLYPDSNIGNCSSNSIVTNSNSCPSPSPIVGPTPNVNGVCDPVGGRLSAMCLYNTVTSGGCSDQGTLALALGGSPPPNDYVASIRGGESVKIYNRVAKPPLNLDIFKNGQASIATVLQEVRQLASNANTNPSQSALGASARDLCLQSGAINSYDFCGDLSDSTAPPYDIMCLQKLFMKMGGQPAGTAYPSQQNISNYNTIPNLGGIKIYWGKIIANLKSSDYNTQRTALMEFLGITPEKLVKRAPWYQGVEVFWFTVDPSSPYGTGLLNRTIESDIPQFFTGDTSVIPQIGMVQYSSFIALTDVRAQSDANVNFNITVNDGFWLTLNQPADFDYVAAKNPNSDFPGFFANNQIQGPTTYQSNSFSNLTEKFPNIFKFYYQNKGGGGHTLQITNGSSGNQNFLQSNYYSLTCEQRAPFINYEVNLGTMRLEDTRNPWAFSQLLTLQGGEYHTRSEELTNVPGNRGFIRLNNGNSGISITNIAFQAWSGLNFAFRMTTMPVNDVIFRMVSDVYGISISLQPINGSTASVSITHNLGGNTNQYINVPTNIQLSMNQWYYILVNQNSTTSISIFIETPSNIINNNGNTANIVNLTCPTMFWVPNGLTLYPPGISGLCEIVIGAGNGSSSFNFDVAFIHYFSGVPSNEDWVREAKSDWIFTQFPTSLNNYTSNN